MPNQPGRDQPSRMKALAAVQLAQAAANAKALEGRAAVMEADQQAAADAATAPPPTDITEYFRAGPIDPRNPVGALQRLGISLPEGMVGAAGTGGARGGQLANQTIIQARQEAGTAETTGPPGGDQNVTIGGQTFEAPAERTTTRESTTVAPTEFAPGFFTPMETRTTERITAPNTLTMGDILQAKQRQEEAEKDRTLTFGQLVLNHSLKTNESRARLVSSMMQTVNAPPNVLTAAADAYLSGNSEIAQKLLAPYDTSGQADIGAKKALTRLYDAKRREIESAFGIGPGGLYDFRRYLGTVPSKDVPTGSTQAETRRGISRSLEEAFPTGFKGIAARGLTPSEIAARIHNAGTAAATVLGTVLAFPKGAQSGALGRLELDAQGVMQLLDAAEGTDHDPKLVAAARRTAERLNLGKTEEVNDVQRFTSNVDDERLRPWVEQLHLYKAYHPRDTVLDMDDKSKLNVLLDRYDPGEK